MANFPMVSMYLMKRKPKKRVNVKALPRITLESKTGSIEIRSYAIYITGTLEGAALALAEDILKHIPKDNVWYKDAIYASKNYIETISVVKRRDSGKYEISLLRKDAINTDTWDALKKDVEKICNNLIAFI